MDNRDITESLRNFNLFSSLLENERQAIAKEFELEQFPKGADIISQGDYGDKVYFIKTGTVEAYVLNKQGQEVTVATLADGSYFGEIALFTDGFRNNSVRTKTACILFSLTKEKLERILELYPAVSRALNKVLSQRLSSTLHIVSEKKSNVIVLMICSEESMTRVDHFENYFHKISHKPIIVLNNITSYEKWIEIKKPHENSYILIKIFSPNPDDFLLKEANHIVNFTKEHPHQFWLTSTSTPWKIEHIVRRITKKTIGIALCSGGAPGAAHIGVLRTLQKEGVPLDFITGTSIGAMIGGVYAFGLPLNDMIMRFDEEYKKMGFFRQLKYLSLNFSGLIRNTYFRNKLGEVLGKKLIENALIPFSAIASDLFTGQTIVIKTGDLVEALVASNAAAVLIEPVKREGQFLIDGVATAPLPVQVLAAEGIDIKIAVPIPQLELLTSVTYRSKLLAIYIRSRCMMAERMMHESISLADVIIEPDVKNIRMDNWKQFHKIVEAGDIAASVAIKRIKYLFNENN